MIEVDGRVCILAIVSDITQTRLGDDILEKSQQELEQRVRELKALHAVVQEHLRECDHLSGDDSVYLGKGGVGEAAVS